MKEQGLWYRLCFKAGYWGLALVPHFRTHHYFKKRVGDKATPLKDLNQCPPGTYMIRVRMLVWLRFILWSRPEILKQPHEH